MSKRPKTEIKISRDEVPHKLSLVGCEAVEATLPGRPTMWYAVRKGEKPHHGMHGWPCLGLMAEQINEAVIDAHRGYEPPDATSSEPKPEQKKAFGFSRFGRRS